ncbi:hypothetical protein [Delftia acidovorans]|uniref:hypothetical protein n=1 Tax=Delftia acidovorans TaxID=80866 RepID=UPI000BC8455E|nr:hypothetical protein [Delftia acidovorans]SOE35289.1 hypothetical protein SAMN05216519_1269 [Delftia acidovorans]
MQATTEVIPMQRLRGAGAMEGSDGERDEDDNNSPAVTVGLAALAIALLAVVMGVLTLLVSGQPRATKHT